MEIFERQYAKALADVLKNGKVSENRTGTDTLSLQHKYFYVKDAKFDFPIIKGKKIFPEKALIEYMWFLNGKNDVKWLNDRNVNYWNKWADETGSIGKSYGYQFRKWVPTNIPGKTFDQFTLLLNEMIENPNSRRLIINLWNVEDLRYMNLPPCVLYYQFNIEYNKDTKISYIDMHVIVRSQDSFLGLPYDIAGAAYFLNIVAEILRFKTGNKYQAREIHYTANDFHIYSNHILQVKKYIDNVNKNKNFIIDGVSTLNISDLLTDSEEHLNKKTLPNILKIWDKADYKNFEFYSNYDERDIYEFIPAEVAV